MTGDDFRDDIAQIEARIEALRDARERCRKISVASKIVLLAGTVLAALTLLTILPFYPSTFFGALAAMLGGAVLLGSNKTTWEQTDEALEKAEAQRRDMIGRIELRLVGEERPTLH